MVIFDGRYVKIQLEGRGGFAEVWKVYDLLTDTIQALKIFGPSSGTGVDGITMLAREYSIMNLIHHENLLTPDNFSIYDNKVPYLVLRYCHRGNIRKLIGQISETEAWQIFSDMANALEYLHKRRRPIIHQDIKPANILYDDAGFYVLTDFGVSTKYKQAMSTLTNGESTFKQAGSQAYMAPERFSRNNRPIFANDIYSLGVTMFELLSDYLPFGEKGGQLQTEGVVVPEVPGDFSPLLKTTIESCLDPNPSKRPLVSKLIEISSSYLSKYPKSRVPYPTDEVFDYYERFRDVKVTVFSNYTQRKVNQESAPAIESPINPMTIESPIVPDTNNAIGMSVSETIESPNHINDNPTVPLTSNTADNHKPFHRQSVNSDWLRIEPVSQKGENDTKFGKNEWGCLGLILIVIVLIIYNILKN